MSEATHLVLFDIDGTLLHGAGPHHREALLAGVRQVLSVEATFDGMDTAGTLDRDLIRALLTRAGVSEGKSVDAVAQIAQACETHYVENCAEDLRSFVCPGAPALLELLQSEGVLIGVVTGNLEAIGWKKLELAGLREYFLIGAFSQDGSTRAELAAVASQRATLLAGELAGITLIGDHRNDIRAAKANRLRAIAVATGVLSSEELLAEEPDLVVNNMTELHIANTLQANTLQANTGQAKNLSMVSTSDGESLKLRAPMVPST